jgi:hypothetical protein
MHGTLVNGERVAYALLRHGDLVQIGPFQFRLELSEVGAATHSPPPNDDDMRQALHIQAAAVAAQQVALEDEEVRLQKKRSDMLRQEEQLAAHLADKQRQVQCISEQTNAEREAYQQERLDHERRLAQTEEELKAAKVACHAEHEKLTQERRRVGAVYERLRMRWKSQWGAERAKQRTHEAELRADRQAIEERHALLRQREAALADDAARFHAERERVIRELGAEQAARRHAQERWRQRRSLEIAGLKDKSREVDGAYAKLREARDLVIQEKNAWMQQLDLLQKELLGLNTRIVNQRARVQEQQEEIARLDAIVGQRQLQISDGEPIECEVEIVQDSSVDGPAVDLERLAGDLAEQRTQLVEQFAQLVEIQADWQQARDDAAADLETLAQRLHAQDLALAERATRADDTEASLHDLQQETETARRAVLLQLAQLQAREQAFDRERQMQVQLLQNKEQLLDEQLANLTLLRARWNARRQEELAAFQAQCASLDQQQKECTDLRVALFGREQACGEAQRYLAEKSLALEQYSQEVACRTKDPDARERLEGLRRRWLALNAALIRDAKKERHDAQSDLARLETFQVELARTKSRLDHLSSEMALREAELDERAASTQARQAQLEIETAQLELARQTAQEKVHVLQAEVETLAKAVYDQPALDKAA